ncbi:hypothetical protein PP744_gp061 [Rhizobium phage RHph_N38]|uniref:Uncharacterized protein n=1 Tax=Rhizobium phage RHph_N38 TaxID=2509750 RepID=A0A7S5UVB0_9CAUD|nr:hypothetical protein PP744_gp061 [Rhizobium phage RHph_N38]QIG70524.1 hypothetical protein EVB89_061 [Rhizobium phage RHph_N38]
MTKHLIIINGRSGAGKDSFVKAVFSALSSLDWVTANISSVQPIKDIIHKLGIEDPDKGEDYRNLIVDIKVALNKYNRYADKLAIQEVRDLGFNGANHLVFLHVRESRSIEFIKLTAPFNWKVSTLWVERLDAPAQANDESYDPDFYDFMITNSGSLDELKAQAIEFAKKFED